MSGSEIRADLLVGEPYDGGLKSAALHGVYYDLSVVLDLFSHYVVGYTVAAREDAQLATELIAS